MPKLVDHRERRREVARATSALIAEAGVGAITIRAIADRLNYSTAIVQHYFSNKRQLLLYTLRMEGSLGHHRIEAASANDPGDLVGMLAAMMPLDLARTKSWKTWLAYWSSAMLDPDIALEQRRLFDSLRSLITHSLRYHGRGSDLRRDIDTELVSRRLLALVHGIGMEAVCHPDDWPPDRQLTALVDEIRDLTGLDLHDGFAEERERLRRGL
ncbi:TetR/AcrR family transcriptional regulator [Sphingomonas profundi]|uniref:TetR/AcrR family transcriptional regulator n=1 Tax=Alterirhizorhabdus profundi TaxID=2681549 RepID=UPI0012E940F8|nr:TetR/AcrR family transcriptional regulator [Sphingomonas profundi]